MGKVCLRWQTTNNHNRTRKNSFCFTTFEEIDLFMDSGMRKVYLRCQASNTNTHNRIRRNLFCRLTLERINLSTDSGMRKVYLRWQLMNTHNRIWGNLFCLIISGELDLSTDTGMGKVYLRWQVMQRENHRKCLTDIFIYFNSIFNWSRVKESPSSSVHIYMFRLFLYL